MTEITEFAALCEAIGWKGPTISEKLHIPLVTVYAIRDGKKECPPADLDWLRRLAVAHEATPRVVDLPADPYETEVLTKAFVAAPSPQSPETDMDPNLVLTTLLDVYGETGEDGAAAISEALNRLGLLDQARAIMRQRAAVKMGLPEVAPGRERFES